jgi:UDPglucose 6-dehydrogenase
MKIGVIGTGYVGLEDKIDKASRGIPHIYEPGLEELLKANLKKGNLSFTPDLDKAIQASDVLFVSVNTPQKEDGSADMTFVEGVSRRIAENLNDYKVVVEKSTVPVKTSMWIKKTITSCKKKDVDFDVASNPEFLREGSAVSDFLNPDRIIIGVETEKARDILVKIYQKFKDRILVTNIDTAEIIKHASNSFLALKISYINLIAELCEKTDADVNQVALGMGFDPRIGSQFLRAGLGYGGSCFPKDIRALTKIGEDLGVNMNLLREADNINLERIDAFMEKTKKALWILKDKKIAVLGLSFKPETDDIREASSIKIIKKLLEEGSYLRLYDPRAMENIKKIFPEKPPQVSYVKSPYEAVKEANALLIITEWDEFKELDLKKIKDVMDNPIIIDGRNVYDPGEVRGLGFEYFSVGRQ